MATAKAAKDEWLAAAKAVTDPTNALPSDAQVIGAVQRARGSDATLVCASGGLPGELHKLWPAGAPGSYHMEYGYSTMGYEIAGGLGVKLAKPDHDVIVMLGDGSYMMMNSEIASSVHAGRQAHHRGARQWRLRLHQPAADGDRRRQLQQSAEGHAGTRCCPRSTSPCMPRRWARGRARWRRSPSSKRRCRKRQAIDRTTVIVIDTDPLIATDAGGHWWDVAVPEVSVRPQVNAARKEYEAALKGQRL